MLPCCTERRTGRARGSASGGSGSVLVLGSAGLF